MASNDNPHLACPYVDCGSSDAFNWNDDGFGHCHSCSRAYPSKDMPQVFDWVKSEYPLKERRNPMDIPITSQTYEGIRGLEADVAELYGIAIQNGDDGRPVRYAYKYPHTVKYRLVDDKSSLGQKIVAWV